MAASGININTLLDRCETDFKHEDRSVRLMCAQRIGAAASCIDDAGMRKRLLDIVSEQSGDEDEVLYTLAGQCGEVFDKWGGASCDEDLAFEILRMLTTIGGTEETVVREEVGKSFTHIVTTAGGSLAQRAVADCFTQLSGATWFTGRVTACLVVAGLCKGLSGNAGARGKVVETYEKLCTDSTPMVRRASARVLSDVATAFGGDMDDASESLLVSLMKKLGLDGEESIRLNALENMDALFRALPTKGLALAREMTTRCTEDASWKMRCAFTKKFVPIIKVVHSQDSEDFDSAAVSKMLLALLRDPEPEVVVAAIGQIAGTLSHFKDQTPILESLSTLMQVGAFSWLFPVFFLFFFFFFYSFRLAFLVSSLFLRLSHPLPSPRHHRARAKKTSGNRSQRASWTCSAAAAPSRTACSSTSSSRCSRTRTR